MEDLRASTTSLLDSSWNLYCSKGQRASKICGYQHCRLPALMCGNEDCQCQNGHIDCCCFKISTIIKRLRNKKDQPVGHNASVIYQLLITTYQQMIEELSILKQEAETRLQYYNLSKNETYLYYNLFDSERSKKITGSLVYSTNQQLLKKPTFSCMAPQIFKAQFLPIVLREFLQAKEGLRVFTEKSNQANAVNEHFKIPKIDSTIIQNQTFKRTLLSFLQSSLSRTQRRSSIKLLIRQNSSQINWQSFHSNCGDKKNTLILIRTKDNRIIGGYTPLQWNRASHQLFDQQNKTFVFSLLNGKKFPCESIKSTYYSGPCFLDTNRTTTKIILSQNENQFVIPGESNKMKLDCLEVFQITHD